MDSVQKFSIEIPLQGESDLYSHLPLWSLWLSTVVLSIAFVIGLPLNGATVLIFWRRKKLRHLVNFVLLLDCLSHIFLCLVCIPVQLVTVWSSSTLAANGFTGLATLQQVVGNFSNVYSTFLTVSIAILRYRRLCWKKKDKFSTLNAIKWSVLSGTVALGLTIAQSYSAFQTEDQRTTLIFYLVKISSIISSMAIVFFCYIRVSQRVWVNAASHEKVMDPIKLRKSRSVHLRATIHSCVQIILVIMTLSPHLYEQTLEAFNISNFHFAQPSRMTASGVVGDEKDPEPLQDSSNGKIFHENYLMNDGDGIGENSSADSDSMRTFSGRFAQEDTSSNTLLSGDNHFVRLIGITINYALLILGTPIAYIASCHRFREQFTSILFSHIMNSPQNSGFHQASHYHPQSKHKLGTSSSSNSRSFRKGPRNRYYSNPISNTNEQPFSSKTTTTGIERNGSLRLARNSLSISTTNGSNNFSVSRSLGGSIRSNKSSLKRTSTSICRRNSRGLLGADFIIVADADSIAILHEQDLSNSNSTNPKGTPSPTPSLTLNETEESKTGENRNNKTGNIFSSNLQDTIAAITSNEPNNFQTVLQNLGCEFRDYGQIV